MWTSADSQFRDLWLDSEFHNCMMHAWTRVCQLASNHRISELTLHMLCTPQVLCRPVIAATWSARCFGWHLCVPACHVHANVYVYVCRISETFAYLVSRLLRPSSLMMCVHVYAWAWMLWACCLWCSFVFGRTREFIWCAHSTWNGACMPYREEVRGRMFCCTWWFASFACWKLEAPKTLTPKTILIILTDVCACTSTIICTEHTYTSYKS